MSVAALTIAMSGFGQCTMSQEDSLKTVNHNNTVSHEKQNNKKMKEEVNE